MTFTLHYTNTLQDYTEANRAHNRPQSKPIQLLICLFIIIWGLQALFAVPPPPPPPPGPPPPPPTLFELLITLATDAFPYAVGVGTMAILFATKPKTPKSPPLLPLKLVVARPRFIDYFPNGILLMLAAGLVFVHVLIAFFLELAHRDGSVPAFWESPLRIIPWVFIVALLWTVLIRRGIITSWHKQTHLQLPQLLTFTEDSVTIQNNNAHSIYQWHAFNQIRETPNLFMLYLSGLSFLMLPKRALAPAEVDAFRVFLQSHIHAPSSAFPVLPLTPPPVQSPSL